jgi:hypothetical protein
VYYRVTTNSGQEFGNLTLHKLGKLVQEGTVSPSDAVHGLGAGSVPIRADILLGEALPESPSPSDLPAISWISTMAAGALSGGYLLNISALRLGIWSQRFAPKVSPILLPLIGLVLPPAHLIYALMLIWTGEKHHVVVGLVHLVVGFFAVEAIGLLCVMISSLIIRRTLLNTFARETGLRINVWLTLLFSSIYLAYKTGEIRAMYGLPSGDFR